MSGIVALVVSMFVWSTINRFTLKNVFIFSILTILILTAISLQSRYEGISILNRLCDISDDGLSSITLQTRLHTYAAAWEVISENPYFGVGLGPKVGLTETGFVVHNIILLNWFESGLFGFFGILLIFFAIAFEGYKGIRDTKLKHIKMLGTALFSSYTAFLVLGIAQPIYYKRFGWISAALLLALYSKRYRSNGSKTFD
jgi:O-antigen ligase